MVATILYGYARIKSSTPWQIASGAKMNFKMFLLL